MKKYYSIGEVSKITDISIDRLRNYDKINLIKPYYVDPKTSYRYYVSEQFRRLRFINYLRKIGVPLKEIKHVFSDDISTEEFVEFLDKKIIEIDKEIEYLNELKNDILEKKLGIESSIKKSNITKIYIKEFDERQAISKNVELNLDFIIDNREEIFEGFRKEKFPRKKEYVIEKGLYLKDYNKNKSNFLNIYLVTSKTTGLENLKIPKGKYLCLTYKENGRDEAIKKIKKYIKENNIKTKGIILNIILKTMPKEEFQFQVLI
ncbi:helix-turn-helix domain-containing protein [Clostridium sp. Ade.TY]|uniref:MerR family transcriptional regulator n=1 Tax=Clostridium sp. Ade.TY TaxID=1391647 RepID=UPI00041E7CBA|nr:helix-turn-helix domain-containing protein [Clostridium sp. Ade.TY]